MGIDTYTNILESEKKRQWMLSREGGNVIAQFALEPQELMSMQDISSFQKWDIPFVQGYDNLSEDIDVHRQHDLFRFNNGELSADHLRSDGVKFRWMEEMYFVKNGNDAAQQELGFGLYEKGQSSLHHYDATQIKQLLNGDRPQYHGQTIQGHHLSSVHGSLNDGRIALLSDPENIRLTSPDAHLRDPIYGHAGNFKNDSHIVGHEVDDRFDGIVADNRHDTIIEPAESRELSIGIASGLVTGTIASVIRLVQFKNDSRPWRKKAGVVAGTFALRGLEGGIISIAVLLVHDHVTEFVSNQVSDIAAQLGPQFSSDIIGELVGSAAGIELAIAIRAGVRSIQSLRHGESLKHVGSMVGQQLLIAGAEQFAFFLLGVALDSITPIPDPVIGPSITALRITYSLAKMGVSLDANRKSRIACTNSRIDSLYEIAANLLVAI